jgi:ribosomal protein S18 acetylase RimI-like enzyme
MIRNLLLSDLANIAKVHCRAFPDSALTKLGLEPVRRYYEWQLTGPHDAVNIGIFDNTTLIGFCFSGVFRGAMGGFLEKNRSFLIRQVATHPWLLLNPLFRERVAFAFKRVFQRKKTSTQQPRIETTSQKPAPSFGILSIAVSPEHQGSGAARLMMEYVEQVAIERGFTSMGLTVHPSNTRAVRFYEKIGWQKDQVSGLWSGRMSKNLLEAEYLRSTIQIAH